MIEIYADGSARNNGAKNNRGGTGICAISVGQVLLTASHQEDNVTNNQMELKGLLYALHLAQTLYGYDLCIIKCDSAYCVNIFNSWINSWYQHGWTRGGNKPIENLDLIKQLWGYKQIAYPNFRVEKVAGHMGLLGNEIADACATGDRAKLDKIFLQNNINPTNVKNIDF